MPSTSKKQHNFMAAVAKNPEFAKKAGVPQSVGREFINADKGRKFRGDTDMKQVKKTAFGGGTAPKSGLKSAYTQDQHMKNLATQDKQLRALPKAEAQKVQLGMAQDAARKAQASKLEQQKLAQANALKMKTSGTLGTPRRPQVNDALRAKAVGTPSMGKPQLGLGSAMGPKTGLGVGMGVKNMGRAAAGLGKALTKTAKKGGLMAGHKSADGIATKGKTKAAKPVMKKSGR